MVPEKKTLMKLVFFVLADAILISLSVLLAFFVRFEGQIPERYALNILGIILLSLVITIPVFYFLKLYHFSWAYVSTQELIALFKGTLLSFLLLTAVFFVLRDHPIFTGFPRATLFISYFFIFFLGGGIRFAKRIYLQIFPKREKEEKERILIVGAGDAGEQILRSILSSKISPYLPVGFIDDNPVKQGALIHGVKVLGKISDIPRLVQEKKIEGLIVALPSASSRTIREAVEMGRTAKLKKIKIIPSLGEIIDGQVTVGNLREVQIQDLLGREPVFLDQKTIENFIRDKRILITGAAGSIGSELSRQVAKFKPSHLIILDQDETGIFNICEELKDKFPKLKLSLIIADILDEEKIEQVFSQILPQIVFHAAAYKHVPLMEENPDTAVKNNIFGTKVVAKASIKNEVKNFIFISTDKAVNPTSIMGATKRLGEMICQVLNQKNSTKFISVRFGNVLDSRGSVIPIFREQIKRGGPVEITHPEMKRYFMICPEACLLVMQAGAMGQGGEVFVLDMGKPIKIVDLAREMIRLSGLELDKDIPIVFTEPRPGEKFFEEVLTAEEGTIATQNQKIFMAKLSEVNEEKLNLGLEKLKEAANTGDKETIIKTLKELIPSYQN
ncbi:MAG: nucleoside-diphosphate sugar epimerase/dehydratase [Patescibacteria group bacterium]|nr:nucleoside-diphosphate sugar epimerase/dehydratase [Patescibacteria group bacterium]